MSLRRHNNGVFLLISMTLYGNIVQMILEKNAPTYQQIIRFKKEAYKVC